MSTYLELELFFLLQPTWLSFTPATFPRHARRSLWNQTTEELPIISSLSNLPISWHRQLSILNCSVFVFLDHSTSEFSQCKFKSLSEGFWVFSMRLATEWWTDNFKTLQWVYSFQNWWIDQVWSHISILFDI